MEFLRSVGAFAKRHKKKLIATAVVVGAGCYIGTKVYNKVQEAKTLLDQLNNEDFMKQYEESVKSEQLMRVHFAHSQRVADSTVNQVILSLRNRLSQMLDVDSLTSKLRTDASLSREERVETWEKLKILSLSRTMAAVYALSLLSLLLRVQLNILGSRRFAEAKASLGSTGEIGTEIAADSLSDEAKARFMSHAAYIQGEGLNKLVALVREAVFEVTNTVSLKTTFDELSLAGLLRDIRANIEVSKFDDLKSVLNYADSTTETDSATKQLLDESLDYLESPQFNLVLKSSLDACFDTLDSSLAVNFVTHTASSTSNSVNTPSIPSDGSVIPSTTSSSSSVSVSTSTSPSALPASLPLAKLLPRISRSFDDILKLDTTSTATPSNAFLQASCTQAVVEFCSLIYFH